MSSLFPLLLLLLLFVLVVFTSALTTNNNSKLTCYNYSINVNQAESNKIVDKYKMKKENCLNKFCTSAIHKTTRNGETHHYMIGGCADTEEHTVCSKMGADGCLYDEDVLAPFAYKVNITNEVPAFCCCDGNECNSWQKLVDNARLPVCYKYDNVFIGEHDSDERMKSSTCPSKVCSSVLVLRTDGEFTRQIVTGDCASERICENIGTDVCLYEEDAARPSLSQKHLKASPKKKNVKATIKAVCCCTSDRCNTVDGLLAPNNFPKLTTNQCYQYSNNNFGSSSEKTLTATNCFGDYCLSRYGSVIDGKGTKMWLDADCTEGDVCGEIAGNATTDLVGCMFGDAALNSRYGRTFMAGENKNQTYKTKLAMVCCCRTNKCNSATALLENYGKETATNAPPSTITSFATKVPTSLTLLTAALLIGGVM